MSVKWIITDLDGCVSPEESIPWDLDLFFEFARLSRAASAGESSLAPLTLCTGRPQPYAEVLMKLLDIRAPVICENGAVLYSLHDNWARVGPGVTPEKIQGLRAVRNFIETELLRSHPEAVMQFGKEAQLSVFSKEPAILREMQPRVEQFARKHGPDLIINCSHYYLNISLAGVDKGSTLRALLEELGVSRGEVAGVGDTVGDLPLREAVGFFACPANAHAEIKAVADYVSPEPTIAGLLDILALPQMQRV
ncbi:MAG TPA: HAD hydrolase family protein [Candidatus Hydrogenedentes bacterium]|nr:HAD hydrolase family protein [Candidatus Hydrogenedentota bacterium]HQE84088.1 HAD hydrolase family protein [Candidatus Hydrogenedentota bacterium]HQH52319.1 HAD hydrolase family protein [Candidatus Hydrogenedentota bacterium]HQM47421.1 HAD hydrolase family protein [Candidatus Hydrogenedentota bacterium]